MKKIDEILIKLSKYRAEIEGKFNVSQIGVFGSFTRGEQTARSDVDILVDFIEPIGLFKFMDLEEYLKGILGKKIDLVSKKALKPRIGRQIMSEVKFV